MNAARLKRTSLLKVSLVALAATAAACLVALVVTTKPVEAAYPGQNGKIAFVRWESTLECVDEDEDGDDDYCLFRNQSEIYTMNPDGSDQANVTNYIDNDVSPTWSPDGTKIAFVSWRETTERVAYGLYIMNADGSDVRNVVPGFVQSSSQITWSPDGTKLAFASYRDGPNELYTVNTDGSELTRITTDPSSYEDYPAWSPDGSKIAFVRREGSGREAIYTVKPDGSELTRITDVGHSLYSPDWSPDGSKIVFSCNGDAICTMNADGSNRTQITSGQVSSLLDGWPSWSPDGSKITFLSTRDSGSGDHRSEIYVMNADGSDQTRLTYDDYLDSDPDWQPLPVATGPNSKAECKKGGYKQFGFKNQGQCIAFVNRAAHNN